MSASGFCKEDENINVEGLMNWPLEYVAETKEYICGWCGQLLIPNHTGENLQTHFIICKNTKDNGRSMVFKELRKMNQKIGKAEENNKTEFREEISDFKSEVKKDLEIKCVEKIAQVRSSLFKKVNALEKGMWKQMAEVNKLIGEVNGRVSGVTEANSTVVHSILKAKGKQATLSADPALLNEIDRMKKETEALWVQLRKSQSDSTRLKDEVAQLKTIEENTLGQLETNNRDCRHIKRQMADEAAKQLAKKKRRFHVEPSPFDQLTIPMNCFNLVTHNYLFQPSFRWIIDDIEALLARKAFELTSDKFQWRGYPVQARAKLQLKEDEVVYMKLCLGPVPNDECELNDCTPVPQVFYLLKDSNARNPRHKCQSVGYLSGSAFTYSLTYDLCLAHKAWLEDSTYKVNNSVEIEIYVEPSPITRLVQSYDGTLEWSFENYKKRLQFQREGLVYNQESPFFYTGPRGYRVQVEIFLNEYEKKGLTARVLFVTGEYDAELPSSFAHSTTLTLINRNNPEKSIEKTVVEDIENRREYDLEVCKLEEVENVVENDTLFCRVSVKSL